MRILFQGDSITDADRNRANFHELGNGYPKYAKEEIIKMYPDTDFEFINLGISGNQTKDLLERVQSDFIDIQPDIVSILVGINDTWHHADNRDWIDNTVFEYRYETILSSVKKQTNAKIMMIEPFLIPVNDKLFLREDLDPKIDIIRKLALKYADVYMPTDGLLFSEFIKNTPTDYASDGVHPTEKGARYIGKLYAQYISKLIDMKKAD